MELDREVADFHLKEVIPIWEKLVAVVKDENPAAVLDALSHLVAQYATYVAPLSTFGVCPEDVIDSMATDAKDRVEAARKEENSH